jgi:TfdA family taurine catabolism dioxygenase TauD
MPMQGAASVVDDNDVVIVPTTEEFVTLSAALSVLDNPDWSNCGISDEKVRQVNAALRSLSSALPSLSLLQRRLHDPLSGFAVWDMAAVADTTDEQLKRRLLVLVAGSLGQPFGAFEKHGFWKSIGVRTDVAGDRVEGIGLIPLHQDFVNAWLPPDVVYYRCVRCDAQGGGASVVACFEKALAQLAPDLRQILYDCAVTEGSYFSLYGLGGERNPFPTLECRDGVQNVRFTAKVISTIETSALQLALLRLNDLLLKNAHRHHLKPGQVLFINQHLACHGREALGQPVISDIRARLLEQSFVRFHSPGWIGP